MASRDDLEWFARNRGWQTASPAAVNGLPSMMPLPMLNRSVQQLPDFNTYYANSDALNPSYGGAGGSDYFFDVLLANKFNQLNLAPNSPAVNNRSGSIPYVDPNLNLFGDMHRMGVRGQPIRGYHDYNVFGGGGASGYGELDNLLFRRQQQNPELNYLMLNKNFNDRSHDIMSPSLSGFDRKRPPRHSLNSSGSSSASLEQLRSKIFSSLEELKGKIYMVAKDQNGCRDLQKILVDGKPEEKEMIFSELKNHIRELMVDQFANYLVQKLFEVCNDEQITDLLVFVISDEHHLLAICLDMHGTRAMQKLLGYLTTAEQRSLVTSALRRITVTLTKSTNGHHVVEHCLKYFPNEDKTYILNVVADNCLDIATDKSGCCVLQQCVEHARGEPLDRLVSEIISNSLVLSEHPYGNYVVQFLIGLRIPHITNGILSHLAGNYTSLSMNKYGSNVVEKCMKETSEEQAMHIIQEIISSPNFLTVLQDPFGNYVAQSAYDLAKGSVRHAMTNMIHANYSYLHSHPHGKRVLGCARKSRHRV